MTITEDSVEKALLYLSEKAAAYGKSKGLVIWLEHKLKIVEAEAFSHATGTMDERRSFARLSKDYQTTLDQYRDAVIECETIRAYRGAAEARIETFRTLEASKRAANIR